MADDATRQFSIGELAQLAGISVRSIRLYEQHGLVHATRAANGRRTFDGQQLSRLRQVLALKAVGLTLAQIRAVLAGGSDTLNEIVDARLASLEEQQDRVEWAIASLTAAKRQLGDDRSLTVETVSR